MSAGNVDVWFGAVLYAGLLVFFWLTEPEAGREKIKALVRQLVQRKKPDQVRVAVARPRAWQRRR